MTGHEIFKMIYKKKEDTKTSYYQSEGNKGKLPARISINQLPFAPIRNGSHKQAAGQLKATYRKNETSAYRYESRSLHSSIWKVNTSIPGLLGTGDIEGTEDLLLFFSHDGWDTIEIHIYTDSIFNQPYILNSLQEKPHQ